MTLRDWKELMAVVEDKVDVIAFGHQGKLEVGFKGKSHLEANNSSDELRRLDGEQ